jgi:hypothetical protein
VASCSNWSFRFIDKKSVFLSSQPGFEKVKTGLSYIFQEHVALRAVPEKPAFEGFLADFLNF